MSALYPEENVLLPSGGSDDNPISHFFSELKKQGGDLLDAAKDKLGFGNAASGGQNILKMELEDNLAGVQKLKAQYAKHDAAFNNISDADFLTSVAAADKDKIHSITDLDNVINNRFNASVDHEKAILDERKAMRDGINYNSKMEAILPGEWTSFGNYSNKSLEGLSDADHAKIKAEFDKDFAGELAGKDQNGKAYSRNDVLKAVQEVHAYMEEHGASRGGTFHEEVWKRLAEDRAHADQLAAENERKAIAGGAFNKHDDAQRRELSHVTQLMGHNDIYIPAEQVENSPHTQRMVDQFRKDFKTEIDAVGGNEKEVLTAIGMVNAKGGEQGMNTDQYRAAVRGALQVEMSGIDLNDDAQRKALVGALLAKHPEFGPSNGNPGLTEDGLKTATLEQQGGVIIKFQEDYANEIKAHGGDAKATLAALSGGTVGTQTQPSHTASEIDLTNDDQRKALARAAMIIDPADLQRYNLPTDVSKQENIDKVAQAFKDHPDAAKGVVDKFKQEFAPEIAAANGDTVAVLKATENLKPGDTHDKIHETVMAAVKPAPGTTPAGTEASVTDPTNDDVKRRVQAEVAALGFHENLDWERTHIKTGHDANIKQHSNHDIGAALGQTNRAANAQLTEAEVKAIDAKYNAQFHQALDGANLAALQQVQFHGNQTHFGEGQQYLLEQAKLDTKAATDLAKQKDPDHLKQAKLEMGVLMEEQSLIKAHPEFTKEQAMAALAHFKQQEAHISDKDLNTLVSGNTPAAQGVLKGIERG